MDPQASPDPLHPHFCEASAPPPRTIICCFDGTGNEFTSKEAKYQCCTTLYCSEERRYKTPIGILLGVGTTAGGLTSRITWQDAQIIMFSMTYFALIWALSILYKLFVKSEHDDDDYRGMTICCLISVGVAIPWMLSWVTSMLDLAIASNLDSHVKLGYIFIMNNYREGDKICLFGFSRGASTARVLAGMIYKVGLLPPQNDQLVDYAYKIFHAKGTRGHHLCMKFKKECCDSVIVDFVGVWDTVSRVGIFPRQATYFTCPTYGIRIFRHALALDERRVQFQANTWADPAPDSGIDINIDPPKSTTQQSAQQVIADIQEVWFPGNYFDALLLFLCQ
ncbi:hypothetical protein AX16_008532 [Volvariella volvacea WC 439]|nr:hypothetical protein AX16_008532 [Volvariella volvacea WC 439]